MNYTAAALLVGVWSVVMAVGIVAARRDRKRRLAAFCARLRALREAGICTICEGTGFEMNERSGVCFGCTVWRDLHGRGRQ